MNNTTKQDYQNTYIYLTFLKASKYFLIIKKYLEAFKNVKYM